MSHPTISVCTKLATKAGVPLTGPGGRSYFATADTEPSARLRVWTDDPYDQAIESVGASAAWFFRGAETVTIEVGPAGRAG